MLKNVSTASVCKHPKDKPGKQIYSNIFFFLTDFFDLCLKEKFQDSFETLLATQSVILYLDACIKQSGQHFQVKMDNTIALRMMNLRECTYIFFSNKKNNNNSNILATKDSSHCNLTTSKLCNESADIPKNKHYSYRNITQAA